MEHLEAWLKAHPEQRLELWHEPDHKPPLWLCDIVDFKGNLRGNSNSTNSLEEAVRLALESWS